MAEVPLPISVASVNDYELIVEGVGSMLRRYPDRLLVRDRIIIGEEFDTAIDVALYDTYGRSGAAQPALRELAADDHVAKIAVFSLDFRPELRKDAIAAGAAGFISKTLSGDDIANALVQIAAGEYVEAVGVAGELPEPTALGDLEWPGKDDGLSARESEVVVLCAQGFTNLEIAASLYIGVETVKTHLRSAYSKLGVRNRVAAAAYVYRSGAFARYQPTDPTSLDDPVRLPRDDSPD